MSDRRRRWRWVVAGLGVLAVTAVVTVAWSLGGLAEATALAGVLVPLLAVAPLLAWAYRSSTRGPDSTPEELDRAARALTTGIQAQWRVEAAIRQLLDPVPLAVRWRPARQVVADHPRVTGTLTGRSDDVGGLVAAYQRLPHRRLVILGGPGSGKTTLAVLLTLELCKRRAGSEPVPVLLSAGSWDPSSEDLYQWVARRLNEDYPALRNAEAYGEGAAAGLVASRQILPVIDGLDELPEGRTQSAVRAINSALVAGDPLIVACRTAEYEAAVEGQEVITGAAVIEPQAVRLADTLAFLRQIVPPGVPTQRWRPVFAELRREPDGPLASALTSPLRISLLRATYVGTDRDPEELLDRQRFGSWAAIENRLLDALVPTLMGGRAENRLGLAGAWDPADARRWLTFLAGQMSRASTCDLAWWDVRRWAPVRPLQLALLTVAIGSAFGLAFGLVFGIRLGILEGFFAAGFAGLFAALLFGLAPADPLPQESGRVEGNPWLPLFRKAILGTLAGPALGLAAMLALGPRAGLMFGIEFSVLGWLAGGLLALPRLLVLDDRSWLRGLLAGLVAAASCLALPTMLDGIVFGPGDGIGVGVHYGLGLALVYGIGLGLVVQLAPANHPAEANLRLRGRGRMLLRWLGTGLGLGVPVGLVYGLGWLVLGLGDGPGYGFLLRLGAGLGGPAAEVGIGTAARTGVASGIVAGLAMGLAVGLAIALVKWAQVPIATEQGTTPRLTAHRDRTFTLVCALTLALAVGLTGWPQSGGLPGLLLGLRYGLLFAFLFAVARQWPAYVTARTWLALRGKLPWRLMAFLEDAHQLGVFRQVGSIYQFRHARLQDHLGGTLPASLWGLEGAATPTSEIEVS